MAIRYGLEGRTVLITGAAGGIGQALAHGFAAQGARLMLLDRVAEPLQALVEQLRLQGADAHAVAITVRDYGVGLQPGQLPMVFNRFWRADPARARSLSLIHI